MGAKLWAQLLPVFTYTGGKLSRHDVQELFTVNWSPQGSVLRDQEEETVFLWECWLMSIQGQVHYFSTVSLKSSCTF